MLIGSEYQVSTTNYQLYLNLFDRSVKEQLFSLVHCSIHATTRHIPAASEQGVPCVCVRALKLFLYASDRLLEMSGFVKKQAATNINPTNKNC